LNSEVVRKPDFPESKSRICNDTIVHWRVLRLCDVPLCGRPKTARDSVVCSLTMHIVASPCDDVQTPNASESMFGCIQCSPHLRVANSIEE
jgi:hypothetical protein